MEPIRIATRKSPLAQRQADLVIETICSHFPDVKCEKLLITTTGDKRQKWSLAEKGGKGLFTKEIEDALIEGAADFAVHSVKDLPSEMPDELEIRGFLPREDPSDMLIMREGLHDGYPKEIASSSPRRRVQGKTLFPNAVWGEIRGNVDTRIKKVAIGSTDATFLAAAGLNRLGIAKWDGVIFRKMPFKVMVPAVGQGAVAVQLRKGTLPWLEKIFCETTHKAVHIERTLLQVMGEGCHTAMGGHFDGKNLHVFHEDWGYRVLEMLPKDQLDPEPFIHRLIADMT
jgi:hydroxymethylbilane synthase